MCVCDVMSCYRQMCVCNLVFIFLKKKVFEVSSVRPQNMSCKYVPSFPVKEQKPCLTEQCSRQFGGNR
uniref:Uncharacterized protein n=1 Tax=Arion vulgaris TaxID=1028688 RepID=A0A0B7A488_9EUPU